jgi:hypothetical protein
MEFAEQIEAGHIKRPLNKGSVASRFVIIWVTARSAISVGWRLTITTLPTYMGAIAAIDL